MPISEKDKQTIRELAVRYGEISHLEVQQERIERYKRTNSLEEVRPVLLISEVPWGEIKDEALVNTCSPELHGIEGHLRRALYQWEHFQVDLVVPPVFRVQKRSHSTSIGVHVEERQIKSGTGTHISAHEYHDVLQTEEDLEKLKLPEVTYDLEATEKAVEQANEVFDGIMPVELGGMSLGFNLWDQIARYRGVDKLLLDLAVRPDFMHKTVQRFAEIAEAQLRQYEELDLLDPDVMLVHCTAAATYDLPADGFEGKVRPKDVWGRCAAQIFGSVSPAMHDEFDLAYNEKLFGECGLVYYGCCEPLERKIEVLRKRFKNLRKVSITPWADPKLAAEQMGSDLVMAAKPNPALVASPNLNQKAVEDDIVRYLEPCKQHGTPCEFVLKDISTIANQPENLTQWAETAAAVIDRYYA